MSSWTHEEIATLSRVQRLPQTAAEVANTMQVPTSAAVVELRLQAMHGYWLVAPVVGGKWVATREGERVVNHYLRTR